VVRHGTEAEARLELPPHGWASQLGQAVEGGVAELDYRLKAAAAVLATPPGPVRNG
jgi:hypothetical protein